MTEITRVPLQPIAKGALTKLWLGVAAVALAAGGVVWTSLPPSVDVEVVMEGTGASPTETDVVTINYKGTLPDGKVFDEGQGAKLPMQGIIPGFVEALEQMKPGGKYKVVIPAAKAYGKDGSPPTIPPNTDLNFEIELIKVQARAQAEAEMQAEQMKAMEAAAAAEKGGKKSGTGAPPGGMPQPGPDQGAPAKPE